MSIEWEVINGRACASCGGGITAETRVRHGGFWLCRADCGHEDAPSPLDLAHDTVRIYRETIEAHEAEIALLREALVFADGRSCSSGFRLADLYAADSEKQGVLQRAGCHPRTAGARDV